MNKLDFNSLPSLLSEERIDNATTILQDASTTSVVFYGIREGKDFEDLFFKRVEGKDFGLLILCGINGYQLPDLGDYYYVDEVDLYPTQKKIMEILYPIEKLPKLVGITGTNGKTTTANLCVQIAHQQNKNCLAVGTIGVYGPEGKIGEVVGNTTPSYIELLKIIHRYQDRDGIFFEFSSHALDQNRHHDLKLDLAGWTSFSQDHLDYHKDIEDYFQAKCRIVNKLGDNPQIYLPSSQKDLKEKIGGHAHLSQSLEERKMADLPLFFQPSFNRDNLELALNLVEKLFSIKVDQTDLSKLKAPKGRFDGIEWGEKLIVIDYAHTPDALSNICGAIASAFPDKKLHTLFGCGGDRDAKKRPLMAAAAKEFSHKLIVTSDNPRSEDPQKIIDDILTDSTSFKGELINEPDRRQGIERALKEMPEDAILLIAGKGHEEYQEIKGEKISLSDFEVVKNFIGS